MKVLIVLRYFYCPSESIGGAERQALKLAQRLIERGVDVTVVSGQWERGQPRRDEVGGVPVHRHFTGWGTSRLRGMGRISQYLYMLTLFLYLVGHRNEYDFIHCHSAMFSAPVVVLAGRLLHKKTLVRAMASGVWGDIKRLREGEGGSIWGTRWMVNQLQDADAIVALNPQVAVELTEIGVAPDRIVHIPNGVEVEHIRRKTDYGLGREVDVAFVGRLHPQKGVDTLLAALRHVYEEHPHLFWRLRLVGSGSRRPQFEALARQLLVEQTVEFMGEVDDPFPILERSDIFVLPSRSEGMSNALLEAMAHGLPCIATDIPGNNDIITSGRNGLLVHLDDEDDLASAIGRLATDQGLRERLGREAARCVEETYSLAVTADRYVGLYTTLLQGD
ncbi:MAG: hypothetical protein DRI81_08965 [Chloroflexi bacterium]|nr:MAG: hypothetical protein DRI81_08965 [Chloroflexota bacterium]